MSPCETSMTREEDTSQKEGSENLSIATKSSTTFEIEAVRRAANDKLTDLAGRQVTNLL
jgi:hypothetical protein